MFLKHTTLWFFLLADNYDHNEIFNWISDGLKVIDIMSRYIPDKLLISTTYNKNYKLFNFCQGFERNTHELKVKTGV